ncbi:hypothetical protein BT69DRAFT_1279146, partial [Atractiella rhizophila]
MTLEEQTLLGLSWMDGSMKALVIANFSLVSTPHGLASLTLLFDFWLMRSNGKHIQAAETLLSPAVSLAMDLQLH